MPLAASVPAHSTILRALARYPVDESHDGQGQSQVLYRCVRRTVVRAGSAMDSPKLGAMPVRTRDPEVL
jgi:hypothetical protein